MTFRYLFESWRKAIKQNFRVSRAPSQKEFHMNCQQFFSPRAIFAWRNWWFLALSDNLSAEKGKYFIEKFKLHPDMQFMVLECRSLMVPKNFIKAPCVCSNQPKPVVEENVESIVAVRIIVLGQENIGWMRLDPNLTSQELYYNFKPLHRNAVIMPSYVEV